ncbi:MAG: CPBP family intramembrane glutamic endopeptidase, partial [Candidatus Glassbacteria bacterium]
MLRKPVFWILFFLIFGVSVIFTVKYFAQAFPIVTLDLRMDRQQALQAAENFAQEHDLGPKGFKQAASFRLEKQVQNFVELEAGGTEAFRKMIEDEIYSPYTWQVRHYREGETNETLVRFTPDGRLYGFVEKLPEDQPGATLPADSARFIAETGASEISGVDLDAFELIEASKELRPGGRTDHTFVYERKDIQIGEGHYRLRLVTGGDKLTELTHLVKIPEAFTRRYEEMRSANNTIASIGLVGGGLLYILGGCVIGLFFLLRKRWVIWRTALCWGIFIAFLQLLAGINQWPLAWMDYDTALSAQGFFLKQIVILLTNFLLLCALLTISFMAAESLSRKAFPHHIQQWRLWSPRVAASPSVLGRTVAGYLLVGLFFAYEVFLYFFSTRVLGWWTPSEALFQPDMLATYFPWLSSIAISAQAGFWEESLFRAVPIAGAALIGQRFGGRKAWIAVGFIIQALIFGAGHANYPNQPAYARVVELIIPSLAFGAVYFYFGLLPAIVLHFAIDVTWFAMPLFVSQAPGIWIDRLLVIVLTLVPLWVVVRGRLSNKRWSELKEEHYNRSWKPPVKIEPEAVTAEVPEAVGMGRRTANLVLLTGVAGLVIWIAMTNFKSNAPPLTVEKEDAKQIAQKSMATKGYELTEDWRLLSSLDSLSNMDDRFIWQVEGEETYEKLMGNYLAPPRWRIRFARFEGDVQERAEEYQLYIESGGQVSRFLHRLPETRPGANLTRDEALVYTDFVLAMGFNLNRYNLKEISTVPSKLPKRTDWELTFADTSGVPLKKGEARITVKLAGDEVADTYRYIHVPEEWKRKERNERTINSIIRLVCILLLVILILSGAIAAIVNWSRRNFSVPVFISFFAILMVLRTAGLINDWPATVAQFSTSEPISNQTFMTVALSLLGSLFVSAGFGLVAGYAQ